MSRELETFRREMSVAALERLLRILFVAFKAARERSADFGQFSRSILPQLRRFYLETELAGAVWNGSTVATVRSHSRGSYTLIETNRLALGVVTRRESLVNFVKPYQFRGLLAAPAQLELFGTRELEPFEKVFALLVFGGSAKAFYPEFARIVFPQESGVFMAGEINLLVERAETVASLRGATLRAPESVPDFTMGLIPNVADGTDDDEGA